MNGFRIQFRVSRQLHFNSSALTHPNLTLKSDFVVEPLIVMLVTIALTMSLPALN